MWNKKNIKTKRINLGFILFLYFEIKSLSVTWGALELTIRFMLALNTLWSSASARKACAIIILSQFHWFLNLRIDIMDSMLSLSFKIIRVSVHSLGGIPANCVMEKLSCLSGTEEVTLLSRTKEVMVLQHSTLCTCTWGALVVVLEPSFY